MAGDAPQKGLSQLVLNVQKRGFSVLLLSADRPHTTLAKTLEAAGADLTRVHFLDCITLTSGRAAERLPNVTYLPSPTMLEAMVMRIEQLLGRVENPYVIVDSLTALAMYSGFEPVQEFSHYLTNRLRLRGLPGDLLLQDDAESAQLAAGIRTFLDEIVPAGGIPT